MAEWQSTNPEHPNTRYERLRPKTRAVVAQIITKGGTHSQEGRWVWSIIDRSNEQCIVPARTTHTHPNHGSAQRTAECVQEKYEGEL